LATVQRNKQDGFSSDTRKLIHKYSNGAVYKWTADGVTGVDSNTVGYGYAGWSDVDTVKDALDKQMVGGYWSLANSGYTGVPVWGSDARWDEGMAIYSADGNVYLVPAGYTGASTIGCKFVLSPGKYQDYIYVGLNQEFRYRFETGANMMDMELTNYAATDRTLRLAAMRGHIKLDVGDALVAHNGIRLEGFDGFSGMFNSAATGMQRDIALDADGDIVVSTGDRPNRSEYGTAELWMSGLTGTETSATMSYRIVGDICHVTFDDPLIGWSNANTVTICGWPAAAFPRTWVNRVPVVAYDTGKFTNSYGNAMLQLNAAIAGVTGQGWGVTGINASLMTIDGLTNEPEYVTAGWDTGGQKGFPAQGFSYSVH
jgi:5-deoxy-D-glucuronate isomerase